MIRRLFWMIAGALLGVTGYRRVSRLARSLTMDGRRGKRARSSRARGDWAGSSVARFARDVRDGMELYADRHPRLAGRNLVDQQAGAERVREAGARGDRGRVRPGIDYAKDGT